jgi:hypothetical protein
MSQSFLSAFRDHPASVGESYFGHMKFALGFAGTLTAAAFCAIVHAFIPPLFETTASRLVAQLYNRTHNRAKAHT